MKPALGRVRALLPTSIAARGVLLVVMTAAAVALPAFVIYRHAIGQADAKAYYERDTFLALALSAYLEADKGTGDHDEWLQRIRKQSQRVLWAGVLASDGRGLEFRRRTALAYDKIAEQIDLADPLPRSRPLEIGGKASERFELLTIPQPEQDAVFAVILDRDAQPRSAATGVTVALLFAGVIGVALAFAWFQFGIQRPIEHLHRRLAGIQRGLTEMTLDDTAPAELARIVEAVQETRREMEQWRLEATFLRHNLDQQVDAKTRRAAKSQERAQRQADTDALTGLGNRRALERQLPVLFSDRRGAHGELSLIVIDVNNFKVLNDTQGHQAGDALLAFIGELCGAIVRKGTDLAVRYGGDEFVLVLPGTRAEDAVAVAQRARQLFAQRVKSYGNTDRPCGLSAGVAARGLHKAANWVELLKMADAAMYYAKRTGAGVADYGMADAAVRDGHT